MRMIFGVAAVTVLLLAGCVGPAPVVTPSETAAEPVFASEEEALAAAEEVFAKYTIAASMVAAAGGHDLAPFDGLVTDNQLADEISFAEQLQSDNRVLVGTYTYRDFRAQQVDISGSDGAYVQAYVCLDFSESHFEIEGVPVEGSDNRDVVPVETVLVGAFGSTSFMVDALETWTGENFCE